jgi:hypothetical protein
MNSPHPDSSAAVFKKLTPTMTWISWPPLLLLLWLLSFFSTVYSQPW